MNIAESISVVSAIVAFASFIFAYLVYRAQKGNSQSAEIARLHELWWSDSYEADRKLVYAFVKEWKEAECGLTPVLHSYSTADTAFSDEHRSIGRIAFFFADLNALIDEGIVSEAFAFRIFGEA